MCITLCFHSKYHFKAFFLIQPHVGCSYPTFRIWIVIYPLLEVTCSSCLRKYVQAKGAFNPISASFILSFCIYLFIYLLIYLFIVVQLWLSPSPPPVPPPAIFFKIAESTLRGKKLCGGLQEYMLGQSP